MNLDILRDLAAHNRAAQTFYLIYERRQNNPTETSVQDLIDLGRKRSITLAPAEVEDFFEALDSANCGRFLRGESALSTRFVWIVKAVDASKSALEGHEISLETLQSAPLPASAAPETPAVEVVAHALRLRPNLTLTLELPADLTPDEARRIGLFVAALPTE